MASLDTYWSQFAGRDTAALVEILTEFFTETGIDGARQMARELNVDLAPVSRQAEDWAAQYAQQLAQDLQDTTYDLLTTEIDDYNADPDASELDLMDGVMGLLGLNIARANLISVTETTRAFSIGNLFAWRAASGIEYKRWNTCNDDIVCEICGPLDGKVVGLNDSFGGVREPPSHPNCRCWITPVVP